ncbi:MAG: hypothetical protein AUJ34_00420 [Parcubacteria group bacterium CG1_02_41_12]|nr:MAG: hypothetical protein AUJ34_00420 [Parcubacteria group bacterium CG1_02_41_12]PIR56936.1 MAG: hypothetical protein COU72_03575 [Parcubacteria group bacterium CG10_big_fil_rev_8_21_14_0_10_41_35]
MKHIKMSLYILCHIAFFIVIIITIITLTGEYTRATFKAWHRITLIVCGIMAILGSFAFIMHIHANHFQTGHFSKLSDNESALWMWEIFKLFFSILIVLIALPPGYLDRLIF